MKKLIAVTLLVAATLAILMPTPNAAAQVPPQPRFQTIQYGVFPFGECAGYTVDNHGGIWDATGSYVIGYVYWTPFGWYGHNNENGFNFHC